MNRKKEAKKMYKNLCVKLLIVCRLRQGERTMEQGPLGGNLR